MSRHYKSQAPKVPSLSGSLGLFENTVPSKPPLLGEGEHGIEDPLQVVNVDLDDSSLSGASFNSREHSQRDSDPPNSHRKIQVLNS